MSKMKVCSPLYATHIQLTEVNKFKTEQDNLKNTNRTTESYLYTNSTL